VVLLCSYKRCYLCMHLRAELLRLLRAAAEPMFANDKKFRVDGVKDDR
jgi:hypothetical protein